MTAQKLSTTAVGLACVGALLQAGPLWLFIPFILASIICTGVGLFVYVERDRRDMEEALGLQDRWRDQRMRAGMKAW